MASRDQLGELANVAQLTGIDAVRLIGMIVQAASTARVHKRNCRQFAQHLRLIGNLLEQLKISELKRYPETREPLEQLEDALRRSFVLVNSCQDKSYLYLLAMGWNIVYQFRKAQNEIDRYLRLVPLITLVDNARVRERLEYIEMDQCEYTFDEEDKKVQDALLNPDEFSHQTAVLTKVLSCSYPNVPLDEALKKEKEKLQMELQRSQSNMDVSQCEVIQHLLGVTDIVANTLPEKGNAKKVDSNNDEKCSDHEEYTTKQANTYVASSRSSTGKDAATITVGIPENGFTLKELAAATNNFSPVNQIGIGSNIYRGELSDGTTVAVKLFNSNTGFAPELDACSRVQHKNIAELIGCCTSTKPTKKFLVYEFVPNRSLHHHLNENNETVLDWSARFKIALGCAKALAYLHQDCNPKIIHCNVKPSNILLDNAFEPKLTNFSVAKILGSETSLETANHVGSLGYIDPEYAVTGQVSEKSDIFSFGVLVLELITGKKPIIRNEIFESLVAWATPLLEQALKKNMYGALVDPRLSYQYNPYEMMRMVACAAAAVRPTGKSRPLMSQIVGVLDGVLPLEVLITRSGSKKE